MRAPDVALQFGDVVEVLDLRKTRRRRKSSLLARGAVENSGARRFDLCFEARTSRKMERSGIISSSFWRTMRTRSCPVPHTWLRKMW